MRSFPVFLIFLFSKVFSDQWNTKDYMKKEYSLTKPYSDDKWTLLGGSMITNNYIRLTPDLQSRKGAIWSTAPCKVVSWELHVHFHVHGSGKTVSGDGMAIWYTKDRMQLGPVFGNMNNFYGLGVFFDTYPNREEKHKHAFPYISVLVNNGSMQFDHDTDGHDTILGGCEASFRGSSHDTFVAIRYEANRLTVSTDVDGVSAWKECVKIDYVHLPTSLYFGASAATGGVSDNHDLISMKLYDIGGPESYVPEMDDIVPLVENLQQTDETSATTTTSSSWSGLYVLFIVLMVIAAAVAICVAIYCYYESQSSKKRFY